jgi:hypothetical protein
VMGGETTDMRGTIKRLVHAKGYGLISAEDQTEYFFHQSACKRRRPYRVRCLFAYADLTAMGVISAVPSLDTLHT